MWTKSFLRCSTFDILSEFYEWYKVITKDNNWFQELYYLIISLSIYLSLSLSHTHSLTLNSG